MYSTLNDSFSLESNTKNKSQNDANSEFNNKQEYLFKNKKDCQKNRSRLQQQETAAIYQIIYLKIQSETIKLTNLIKKKLIHKINMGFNNIKKYGNQRAQLKKIQAQIYQNAIKTQLINIFEFHSNKEIFLLNFGFKKIQVYSSLKKIEKQLKNEKKQKDVKYFEKQQEIYKTKRNQQSKKRLISTNDKHQKQQLEELLKQNLQLKKKIQKKKEPIRRFEQQMDLLLQQHEAILNK